MGVHRLSLFWVLVGSHYAPADRRLEMSQIHIRKCLAHLEKRCFSGLINVVERRVQEAGLPPRARRLPGTWPRVDRPGRTRPGVTRWRRPRLRAAPLGQQKLVPSGRRPGLHSRTCPGLLAILGPPLGAGNLTSRLGGRGAGPRAFRRRANGLMGHGSTPGPARVGRGAGGR